MLTLAIMLVCLSAFLHVTWNVKLQSENDPLDTSTKAVIVGLACLTPFIAAYWLVQGAPIVAWQAVWFSFLSGVAELGYFFFLSYSYKRGELSVVYPIARGSAPALAFIFGVFFLQEHIHSAQIIGVLCLLLGIWLVRGTQVKGKKGAIPALITGFFIAAYTVIDKIGLNYADPIIFGELKYFFTAICLAAFIPLRHKLGMADTTPSRKTNWKKIALIGICIIATYQLVLFALSLAPVAIVSPLRESASVLVTIWGIWRLKEREGILSKSFGVVAIFGGITLLAF